VNTQVPTSPVPIGTVLANKYVVERILGVGGMGVVVAARHRVLDQHVALKFLYGPALENPEIVARFIREARVVVKLESQFVARVSDVGMLDSGSPFIVMELLEGLDLAQRIEQYPAKGPLPIAEGVDRILEALDALAEAHSHDVVHRDLKPANLFLALRADGSVATKVLDFGVSKVVEPAHSPSGNLTRTMATLGTPLYMAPEQVRSSKSVDVRADVWAIGVVLYEVLSGHPPFDGNSMGAVFAAILETQPASLLAQRRDLDPQLEAVVARCLEKDPAKRYGDVAQLAQALAPFGSGRALASVARAAAVLSRRDRRSGPDVTAGGGLQRLAITATSASTSFAQPATGALPAQGRGRLVLAVALGVAIVAGGALFAVHSRSPDPKPEPISATQVPLEPTATGPMPAAPRVGVPPELAVDASPATSSAPQARPAASHHRPASAPSAKGPAATVLPEDRL
jgi:hypothetical protein